MIYKGTIKNGLDRDLERIARAVLDRFGYMHHAYKFPIFFDEEVADQTVNCVEVVGGALSDEFGDKLMGIGVYGGRANGLSTLDSDTEMVVFCDLIPPWDGDKKAEREYLLDNLFDAMRTTEKMGRMIRSRLDDPLGMDPGGGIEFFYYPRPVFCKTAPSLILWGDKRRIYEAALRTMHYNPVKYEDFWEFIKSAQDETMTAYKPRRMVQRIIREAERQGIEVNGQERRLYGFTYQVLRNIAEMKRRRFGMAATMKGHKEWLEHEIEKM